MKIGLLGSGQVAQTLGRGFLKHGHEVMLGTRDPSKLKDWIADTGDQAKTGSFLEAAVYGELIVLAVKGSAAENVLEQAGPDSLTGKTVIDVTNPIAEEPPDNGVIRYFTSINESLMERLQLTVPGAYFVKAFNSVGNAVMVDPEYADTKPTMFICGDNRGAKSMVSDILDSFGWETADMGGKESARAIEPLCMLWCIPGMLNNEWTHAFKLLLR